MIQIGGSSRLALAVVASVSLLVALSPSVSAASRPSVPPPGTTRWVDNDGAAGPNGCGGSAAAFKKVQTAVNHSGPNDTIMVCPGTYRGTVEVSGDRAGLTIRGTNPWKAVLVPPIEAATAGIDTGVELIKVQDVNDVTIRGLRLSAASEPGCVQIGAMIDLEGSLHSKILGNQIYASANPGGCGYAVGIIVDSGEPVTAGTDAINASALVAHNLVSNFQVWGISAGDQNVDVKITDNSLHYYLTSHPELLDAASARVAAFTHGHRFSSAVSPAGTPFEQVGIFIFETVTAVIDLNVIQSAPDANLESAGTDNTPQVLESGISVEGDDAPVIIRDNLVRRVGYGIVLNAVGATVDRNVVRTTVIGIGILGGGDNRARHNTTSGLEDGLLLSSSHENILRANTAHSASGLACEDDSSGGSGTDGTDSLWVNNTGNSDSPDGICPPAAP